MCKYRLSHPSPHSPRGAPDNVRGCAYASSCVCADRTCSVATGHGKRCTNSRQEHVRTYTHRRSQLIMSLCMCMLPRPRPCFPLRYFGDCKQYMLHVYVLVATYDSTNGIPACQNCPGSTKHVGARGCERDVRSFVEFTSAFGDRFPPPGCRFSHTFL